MRGSGHHGLKLKLAEKLHPSASLTTAESSRLLTALKSSFRKHLDEVHPTHEQLHHGKAKSPASNGAPPRPSASSASFTQKHMTSVLTNPLLMASGGNGIKGFASAKAELKSNPRKDPIALLEEYEDEGVANFRVAELCIDLAVKHYKSLNPSRKLEYVRRAQPGSRVLSWLLNSSLHDVAQYADNIKFFDHMALALLREGREDLIWRWMKLDTAGGPSVRSGFPNYRFKWRSNLLYSLVRAVIGSFVDDPGVTRSEALASALDTFAFAAELGSARSSTFCLPLGHTARRLTMVIAKTSSDSDKSAENGMPFAQTIGVRRYETFMSFVPLWTRPDLPHRNRAMSLHRDMHLAVLELFHPRRPSADRAYQLVSEVLADDPSANAAIFLRQLKGAAQRRADQWKLWCWLASKTVHHLREQQLFDEEAYVVQLLQKEFPALVAPAKRPLQSPEQIADMFQPVGTERLRSVEETEDDIGISRNQYPVFG